MKHENASPKSLLARRALILMFCLLAATSPAAARRARHPLAGRIIASIKIEALNVFDTATPPENKFFYRTADDLHRHTRAAVVERELLFAVGEPYDAAIVAETERNLRALPFIRHANVFATANKNGTVDLVVRTYDSWSLAVDASYNRAGGVSNLATGITENNILGEGKGASVSYNRNGPVQNKSFGYEDPQFLSHKYLQYTMTAISSSGNQLYSVGLERPFYATIAPSAWGGALSFGKSNISTYNGDQVAGTVSQQVDEAGVNYGIAIATSTERERHIKFGLLEHHAEFQPIPGLAAGPVPRQQQMVYGQLGADWVDIDFIKARQIQTFTHVEDYNLGFEAFPAVSWAPAVRAFGSTGTEILPSLVVRKGFQGPDQLLFLSASYSSKYVEGGNGNRLASFDGVYFVQGLPRQTLAFHTDVGLGWHLDPAMPLTLGELTGLRGYGLTAFSGNRLFLFNAEDRIYIKNQLFRLIDVGAVAFYDSGYVWPAASAFNASELRNSVGVGLRLAPSRSAANNPVRIDLAYALDNNQSGSRWALSIVAGQAFGPGPGTALGAGAGSAVPPPAPGSQP